MKMKSLKDFGVPSNGIVISKGGYRDTQINFERKSKIFLVSQYLRGYRDFSNSFKNSKFSQYVVVSLYQSLGSIMSSIESK